MLPLRYVVCVISIPGVGLRSTPAIHLLPPHGKGSANGTVVRRIQPLGMIGACLHSAGMHPARLLPNKYQAFKEKCGRGEDEPEIERHLMSEDSHALDNPAYILLLPGQAAVENLPTIQFRCNFTRRPTKVVSKKSNDADGIVLG